MAIAAGSAGNPVSVCRILHLREKERSEGAGWTLPSPGCSYQFSFFPAVLCIKTFGGLRDGESVPSI